MIDPLDAVREQLDRVAADAASRWAEIEAARTLPRDLVEALVSTGVFRLTVSEDMGGFGSGLATAIEAIEACAYHEGSTGWCVMAGILAGFDASALPEHHAATVFGDAGAVVGGNRATRGEARITEDGGLIVTGRWPLAVGVGHCTWVGGGARVCDRDHDGDADSDTDGDAAAGQSRDDLLVFFRRDQVVVLDTWHALGLRGAGATDFQVTEAFVPEGRWVGAASAGADARAAAGAAAVALGLARRAVDETVAAGRVSPDGADLVLAARPTAQITLARLDVARRAAADHLALAVDRSESGPEPDSGPDRGRGGVLAAALYAVEVAGDVVDRCHRLVGTAGILHASPLQRLLRDVHVISQHPSVSPAGFEAVGRERFGQSA